jgi:hypothetical protein
MFSRSIASTATTRPQRKAIAKIVKENHQNGNGFRDLILALVESETFRTKWWKNMPEFSSALSIKLDSETTICDNLHTMDQAGLWKGRFLDLQATQHYRKRGGGSLISLN